MGEKQLLQKLQYQVKECSFCFFLLLLYSLCIQFSQTKQAYTQAKKPTSTSVTYHRDLHGKDAQ